MSKPTMNGAPTHYRGEEVFIAIPADLQQPCGPCDCPYCKAHPEHPPHWDTLAVRAVAPRYGNERAWTVHYPDMPGRTSRERVTRRTCKQCGTETFATDLCSEYCRLRYEGRNLRFGLGCD